MDASELLCLFRQDTSDEVEPYLWSNTEVFAYMNDAYYMFVRKTGGIPDATTPEVVTLTAAEDTARTDLHESIMRVRTARNTTLNRPVTVINTEDEEYMARQDYGIVFTGTSDPDVRGRPDYLILGEEEGSVRWVNVPDQDYTIQLTVERLPLTTITRPRDQFTGVRAEHHYHLLKWMRHLAYLKQDADTFDQIKSDNERAAFLAYCDAALNEKATRKHKVRVVRYGGL